MIGWNEFVSDLDGNQDAITPPGTRRNVLVELATSIDGQAISLPFIYLRGAADGPKVWINASIHGNEILATQAAIDVANSLNPEVINGEILVIPVLNVTGFQQFDRESPYDFADMNRIWDKDPHSLGYLATFSYFWIQRTRKILDAFKPDCLIDLHDGGVMLDIMSHVLYASGAEEYSPGIREVAEASGMKVIWRHEGLFFGGSSTGEANARQIPGFIVESGGTGELRSKDVTEMAVGTLNILTKIGSIQGEIKQLHEEQLVMTAGNWIRPEFGGIFHSATELGQMIGKGELIGTIINTFGDTLQNIQSPADGIVFGIRKWGICNMGDYVANVGVISN